MRITMSMMMKNYAKNLSDSLDRENTYSLQLSTQMKFQRASDDPVDAVSSLKGMHDLAAVNQDKNSVSMASSWLTNTDSTLTTINSILQSTYELATSTVNGSNSTSDDENNATNFENYQSELFQMLNSTFGGKYVFGGDENGPAPYKIGSADDLTDSDLVDLTGSASGTKITFTTDSSLDGTAAADGSTYQNISGKLLYYVPSVGKYIPVSDISNSTSFSSDPKDLSYYSINNSAVMYSTPVDLGMGQKVSGYKVDLASSMDISTSALKMLVQGPVTGDTVKSPAVSTNVYDEMTKGIGYLKNDHDSSKLQMLLGYSEKTQDSEASLVVEVGSKEKMSDFVSNQLTNQNTNLTSKISLFMDADATTAAYNYQLSQTIYNAALTVCSKALQKTLIDFLG